MTRVSGFLGPRYYFGDTYGRMNMMDSRNFHLRKWKYTMIRDVAQFLLEQKTGRNGNESIMHIKTF
nr:CMF_HP1_G0006570.mRNA.1.CDS.1 [Saccharomyces cerevisiae]